MLRRLHQFLLLASLAWFSWLVMMLAHEAGHILGAISTGGTVRRVVWHPLVLSRTDVQPNPQPLVTVWAGPVIGCLLPIIAAILARRMQLSTAYLFEVIAGFCMIANGAYIGVGSFDPVGDAAEMIRHGTPRWLMAGLGLAAAVVGLWMWHRASPQLGFGRKPQPVDARHAWVILIAAIVLTAGGFVGITS